MAGTAQTIIERIKRSQTRFVRVYKQIPRTAINQLTLPTGESAKDLLAKIAAWEWRCAELLTYAHDSNGPLLAKPDVQELNREIYNERKAWSWEEVELDFLSAHQQLLNSIKALPEDRLNDIKVQALIARNTWQAYDRHLPALQYYYQRELV